MKILFVYDMMPEHSLYWRDGLWGAIHLLGADLVNIASMRVLTGGYDFVLGWGSPVSMGFLSSLKIKKGLCFGGGDINDPILDKFDVVFVENESQMIKPHFRHAFGTNTDLFRSNPNPKLIDALYPAAFAQWKHQEKFADICQREKLKGLAVGYIQENNLAESLDLVMACVRRGVSVMDWIPGRALCDLYNMSKEVIITADSMGGCERTILEAKACDIPVRIESDSEKLHVLNKLTPEEVRENWNHIEYSRKIKEGIDAVLTLRK